MILNRFRQRVNYFQGTKRSVFDLSTSGFSSFSLYVQYMSYEFHMFSKFLILTSNKTRHIAIVN